MEAFRVDAETGGLYFMATTPLIPLTWDVPETFRKRLGTTVGKQRAMEADGHLLLVVHLPPAVGERFRRGRLLWRDPAGEWQGSDTGSGLTAVRKHLEQYHEVLDGYDKAEAAAIKADDYLPLLEGLAPLQRSTRNLELVMQEARKLVSEDRHLIDFRDQAYELARTTDLLYTDAKNGMEIAIIRRAEQQAAASERTASAANRFNLLVAFFFPIGMLAGIMGVNLQNGLEKIPPPWPIVSLILMGILGGTLLALHINRVGKER
jgi:hypothetical protein